MKADEQIDIGKRLADLKGMQAALAAGVRAAVRRHKLLGNPIAAWKDGRVVWLAPDEIELDE